MIRYWYLVTITLFVLLAAAAHAQVAGEGRSFVVTIPAGATANIYNRPLPRLLMTSRTGASVQVQYGPGGRVGNISVAAGAPEELVLDSADVMLPEAEGIFINTLIITSDNPITVDMMLDRAFASEAYAALPDALLGMEYFAVSTNENEYGSSVVVIGVQDSTSVTITPTNPTRGGHARAIPFTVKLNRGETFQLLSNPFVDVDLTGTVITSDRPCGVLSGSICADLNVGFEHRCNPLIEQLPGTESWGKTFMVGPLERASLTPFRVVARCQNTSVKLNGRELAVLNRGEYYQMLLDTSYEVTTSEPAMIAAMVASTSRGLQDRSEAYGDPALMIVAPREQWSRRFSFAIPSLAARQDAGDPVGWRHFIQIAMTTGSLPGILVDGAPPALTRVMTSGGSMIGTVEIGPGMHTVISQDPIGVHVYGYSVSDAYGFNPASIDHRTLLDAPDVAESVCASTFDTTITVRNLTNAPVTVDAIELSPGLDVTVVDPAFPFTVPAGGSIRLHLRFNAVASGQGHGSFSLVSGACRTRLLSARLDVDGSTLEVDPPSGSLIDFGTIANSIPFSERTIRVTNRGTTPVTIQSPLLTGAAFTLQSPAFPLRLAPGASANITIRFASTSEGRFGGRFAMAADNCPDSVVMPLVAARSRGSFLTAIAPPPSLVDCHDKRPRKMPFTLANIGDLPLDILDAVIVGDPDFTFESPLKGVSIQPGDTLRANVIYTPGPLGTRSAAVRLTTTAINDGKVTIGLEAHNDTAVVRSSLPAIDLGTTLLCDSAPGIRLTLVNTGTLFLERFSLRSRFGTLLQGSFDPLVGLLKPGDSIGVTITLDSSFTGDISDSVTIDALPCLRLVLPLRGRRVRVALASPDVIDFGFLPACDSSGFLALTLRNDGMTDDTLTVTHLPSAPFTIDPAAIPRVIAAGDSAVIPVRYQPLAAGQVLDSLEILWGSCATRKRVRLLGAYEAVRPTFDAGAADFGAVEVGGSERRRIWLVNTTVHRYSLGAAALSGALRGVRIIGAQGEITLDPGDSALIELAYTPDRIGDTLRGFLLLPLVAPCADTLRLQVMGSGTEERTKLALRWRSDSAWVGTVAPLRLELEQTGPDFIADTLRIDTRLRTDGSIIVPLDVSSPVAGASARIIENRLDGGDRLVTLRVEGMLPRSGTIAELRARVALGGADSARLAFDSVHLVRLVSGVALQVRDTIAGALRVLGICRVGGSRLVGAEGFFRLEPSRPNPVSALATIEFETIERGRVRLALGDARGAEMMKIVDDDLEPGIYQLTIDARSLPSGIYWLTLQSPTDAAHREMIVVR